MEEKTGDPIFLFILAQLSIYSIYECWMFRYQFKVQQNDEA